MTRETAEPPGTSPGETQPPHLDALLRPLAWSVDAPWTVHAPFVFWIVAACRPASIVEIGFGEGASFLALCQAAAALDPPARCTAVDLAVETPAARPDPDTRTAAEARRGAEYASFSEVIRATAEEVATRFPPGSIDLLHLRADLAPDATEALLEGWAPQLSPRGVLLVHGTAAAPAAGARAAALGGGAGYARSEGAGLLAVATGPERPAALDWLLARASDAPERVALDAAFARLGRLAALEARDGTTATQLTRLRKDLEAHRAALKIETRVAGEAQARFFDQTRELETERDALARTRIALAETEAELDDARADRTQAVEDAARARKARRAAESDLAELHGYARDVERRHRAMLESETWRVLEPARKVLRLIRRRPEPAPFVPRLEDGSSIRSARKSASESAAVRALDDKLWGGFSLPALAELEAIKVSSRASKRDLSEAAYMLARWRAAEGDHAAAHENVVLMRTADPSKQYVSRCVLLEAECLRRLGQPGEARALLDEAIRRKPDSADLRLAMANSFLPPDGATDAATDRTRLSWFNQIYDRAGLARLALHDPDQPFTMHNLAAPGAAQVTGPGDPRVSVILPAYAAEATLPFALRGLLAQTWANLEILVVDDCSPDDTLAVAKRIADEDPRVRVLRQPENRGGYAARNAGLWAATGDFVTTHDADDWSHPQKIELQMRRALAHPEAAANFSDWVRCSDRMHVGWLYRAWGGYSSKSMSSILLQRGRFDALGGWDDVRVGGDTDLLRRVERLFGGPKAVELVQSGTPLAFSLHSERSLTQQSGSHVRTMLHGARREYAEAGAYFRETVGRKALRFPPEGHGARRPFPAPRSILGRREGRETFDLLFVSDFSLKGGAFVSTYNYIEAARAAGLSVGLFHWRRYDLPTGQPLNPVVRRLAQAGEARILAPGEAARAQTMIVGYPVVLAQPVDRFPEVEVDDLIVVVNQMANRLHGGGDPQYDPDALRARLRGMFGREGVWVPISGLVGKLMRADPRYPAPSETIWTPLIDTAGWCAAPLVWRGGSGAPPTVGRHARDHYTKWPSEADPLRAAYCADRPCQVEIMGGADRALAVIGAQPANWTVLPFGAFDSQDFLARLDIFLHYPHEDYIEEFGRAVLEALAAGKPAILPPVFRQTFGEAAVYAEPADVWDAVAALWTDEAAYLDQARRGRDFVLAQSDWSRFPGRLAATLGRAAGVAAAPALAETPA